MEGGRSRKAEERGTKSAGRGDSWTSCLSTLFTAQFLTSLFHTDLVRNEPRQTAQRDEVRRPAPSIA